MDGVLSGMKGIPGEDAREREPHAGQQPQALSGSDHAGGQGVQFEGKAGVQGAEGTRRPGEPVKNVMGCVAF